MSSDKTSLGDRMKGYEQVQKHFLMRRNPTIIRLDGKAFHTFTKGMKRPFDWILQKTMQDTMQYLCSNIQNCKLGYTQSDEITLLLVDYDKLETDAWFGNNVQKMASVSASMTTLAFNQSFKRNVFAAEQKGEEELELYVRKYDQAMFDSRVFSIPKEEVCNCFVWRQQDATRNSIQSMGQAHFSCKQLHGKSTKMIQEMLHQEKGINWNDLPIQYKRGSCCVKRDGEWMVDLDIPIFSMDREYVERYVFV